MRVDRPDAGAHSLRLSLSPDVHAPAAARNALRELDLGPREDDVLLMASELVTNAVEHAGLGAGDAIELAADRHDGLTRVEVCDHGSGFLRDRATRSCQGLRIVAALTQHWGVEQGRATRVWFEVEG